MMPGSTAALALFLMLLLAGCATQSYVLLGEQGGPPDLEETQEFYLGGVGQTKHLDAAKVCKGAENVAKVETTDTPVNILFQVLTLGLYSPRTVRVYCLPAAEKMDSDDGSS